jgi:signal transduction histidine kinase
MERVPMQHMLDIADITKQRKSSDEEGSPTPEILHAFDVEKRRLEEVQRATLNILDDFESEKRRLEQGQRATINILEDFNAEKARLEQSQKALLNILDDFEAEKTKVETAKRQLEINEVSLHEKNVELERASLAKDRFLASMSHELRTPMNAIIGFTGTLLMKLAGPVNTEQERQLKTIQTSSRYLLSLINDLLDLAKIESGKVEVKPEEVQCARVLEEVLATLSQLAQEKGLAFSVEIPPAQLYVYSDHRAIRQILLNLTNNAIKFTEKGAVRVNVECRKINGKEVVEFVVNDSGIGIQMEERERLFKAFSQVGAGNRRRDGTGLGLHLSQKLAALLGGGITLESEFGKGSTFRFWLERHSQRTE